MSGRQTFGLVIGIAGVVGAVASVASLIAMWFQPQSDTRFVGLSVSIAICFASVVALLTYMVATSRRETREMTELSDKAQRLQDERTHYERRVNELQGVLSGFRESLGDIHQVVHSFRDKLIEVVHDQPVDEAFFVAELDLAKSIFDKMTGGNCAACIKVFVEPENGEPTLKTLCRDTRSQPDRGLMDMSLEFKVSKNTAFNVIMNGGERWFASNDLTEEGNYLNDTPSFEKHYKSAIVVPIRSKWESNYYHDGFLAVDSLQPGVFDMDNHPYLLAAIGDLLQPMLSYYRSSLEE